MPRPRKPERDEAKRKWLESFGTITTKKLAASLNVGENRIRKWKCEDRWNEALEKQKRKRGGQPGNKNSLGGGAPYGNRNAETHGAYNTVRYSDLTDEQQEYINNLSLDPQTNMLNELQMLVAKELDLRNKIIAIENDDKEKLYIDRVIELRSPKGKEQLAKNNSKLEELISERNILESDIEFSDNKPTKRQEEKLKKLNNQIAELQDKISDAELELANGDFKVDMQTVMKSSAFERRMKLDNELSKVHSRVIKLIDSIKAYETDARRLELEERKYEFAKQKALGEFEIEPEDLECE